MKLTEALQWRYATKRMTGEKISEIALETILEAIRLAPSAYGLQPYKVIVTENKELLNEIYEKACSQLVILQCSHLLIFKAKKRVNEEYVEGFLREIKQLRNSTEEYIEGYRGKLHKVLENPEVNTFSWATQQTYIALGFATFAAAQLNIDATPIEGFDPRALNQLLSINVEEEEAVVMLTLGFRDEKEDRLAHQPKVRKPLNLLVERL